MAIAENATEACFQVINAYSTESQLDTLCVDLDKFNVSVVDQSCADCDNAFYGSIAPAIDLDQLWVLITGALVFFMQTGFTMCAVALEAGSVKISNVQNILFKNMMDACVGAMAFYLFGYAVAYGDGECSVNGFMGCENVALSSLPVDWNSFFFQWAFAATAATIVSGSVAERCSLGAYFSYTTVLSVWVYPVLVHWFWSSNGWLSAFNPNAYFPGGVIDFAGSGVVHMCGGWSGLMGAIALGPRINRFDYDDYDDLDEVPPAGNTPSANNSEKPNGSEVALNGDNSAKNGSAGKKPARKLSHKEKKHYKALQSAHTLGNNVPFQVLGTFILWFGWYGFNPGSTLAANNAMEIASKAAVTSTIAAAGGGIVAATVGRVLEGYFSLPRVCNGILAGLVSITAPCSVVDPGPALAIGVVGAFVYYTASRFLERVKVDDPLDAWAVHGCGGAWGVISVALFASSENIAFAGYNETLVEASKGYRLSLQLFAVFIIIVWVVAWIGSMFFVMRYFGVLRVDRNVEKGGLDQSDHGGVAMDFKTGYSVKDPKTRRQLTVFGRGLGTSGTTSGSGSETQEEELLQQTNIKQSNVVEEVQGGFDAHVTTVASLQTGRSRHKKLRPNPTGHIKKYADDSEEFNDDTELVPMKSGEDEQ